LESAIAAAACVADAEGRMALGLRAVDSIPPERAGAEALRRRRPEFEPSPALVIADGGERT